MVLRDVCEAKKTPAKNQETAVAGTRQQETLGKKDCVASDGSLTAFALILEEKNKKTNLRLILMKHQWLFCKNSFNTTLLDHNFVQR